eukprot:11559512-Alexandrium_andersonii.AAC.1
MESRALHQFTLWLLKKVMPTLEARPADTLAHAKRLVAAGDLLQRWFDIVNASGPKVPDHLCTEALDC